jgi:hypothetical protein
MYFARSDPFDVVWISDPDSRHSRNLLAKPSAAVTIYDSHDSDPVYRFRPREVKLFYERILGAGTLVSAKVIGERLAWARTQVFA